MKFGTQTIPEHLFELARERLRQGPTITPAQMRQHLIKNGAAEMTRTNSLPHNHRIIAARVFSAVRKELQAQGEIAQLKRGVWATTKFLDAAA
jgi:hypothetical protein